MKLREKVAVVTGGNSGIGLAISKEFVKEGDPCQRAEPRTHRDTHLRKTWVHQRRSCSHGEKYLRTESHEALRKGRGNCKGSPLSRILRFLIHSGGGAGHRWRRVTDLGTWINPSSAKMGKRERSVVKSLADSSR